MPGVLELDLGALPNDFMGKVWCRKLRANQKKVRENPSSQVSRMAYPNGSGGAHLTKRSSLAALSFSLRTHLTLPSAHEPQSHIPEAPVRFGGGRRCCCRMYPNVAVLEFDIRDIAVE